MLPKRARKGNRLPAPAIVDHVLKTLMTTHDLSLSCALAAVKAFKHHYLDLSKGLFMPYNLVICGVCARLRLLVIYHAGASKRCYNAISATLGWMVPNTAPNLPQSPCVVEDQNLKHNGLVDGQDVGVPVLRVCGIQNKNYTNTSNSKRRRLDHHTADSPSSSSNPTTTS